MTQVYITIDTEYSSGLAARIGLDSRAENFARSIACVTPEGAVGIPYQLDCFDRHGLKAVFFVDPMPALIWGVEAISDIVGPIVARGHDVQLHLHSEWLELAGSENPLGSKTGQNIKDFSLDEQCVLLDYARSLLIAAGAPRPTAFRAGNYGANDDTLRALAQLGFTHETSHCPGIAASLCDISLTDADRLPVSHMGLTEVPIACIASFGDTLRHAQITALSAGEMLAAIRHARDEGLPAFTLVSHSFELLSRDRLRINHILKRRFERFCAGLARMSGVTTATYAKAPPSPVPAQPIPAPAPAPILPHSFARTGLRFAEQVVANSLYGAK